MLKEVMLSEELFHASASLSMRIASILISPMSTGVPSRLEPMVGACSIVPLCGSVGLHVAVSSAGARRID